MYFMQQMERKWTETEVQGFLKWDQMRKNDELGNPMRFKTVKDLRAWLDSQ